MNTYYLSLLFALVSISSYAQINDSFIEDNLSNRPEWDGSTGDFIINAEDQLQLNASGAGESFLVTHNNLFSDSTVWEFSVSFDFNPSSSNNAKVYLASDSEDLTGPLNGYYVMIGDTEDEISLYRQEGTSDDYLINGEDKIISESSVDVRIRVIRSNDKWYLFQDITGGENYVFVDSVLEETPFLEPLPYFGIFCDYTSTRADKIFFDDIKVRGEVTIKNVEILASDTIQLAFNQPVLVPVPGHFSLVDSQGDLYTINEVLIIDSVSFCLVVESMENSLYQLIISEATDLTFNNTYTDLEAEFSYEKVSLQQINTLSEGEILLTFNQGIHTEEDITEKITLSDGLGISAYEINGNKISLYPENPLVEDLNYQIEIRELRNVTGNSRLDTTGFFEFIIPIHLDSVWVTRSDELQIRFNKELSENEAINPNNYELSPSKEIKNIAIHEDAKTLIILVDSSFKNENYTLNIKDLKDSKGHIQQEEIITSFSYLPLEIDTVFQVDSSKVRLFFNQSIDENSSLVKTNYTVDYLGNPKTIEKVNDSTVELSFESYSRAEFTLLLSEILNRERNSVLLEGSVRFFLDNPAGYKSIVFTELMPDPTPVQGLPDAEYVEIYNRSKVPVNLYGFLLNDESLPQYQLDSGAFLVLTDDSDVDKFNVSNVLGISSFDALTNSGESVVLKNVDQTVIDSLYYESHWYDVDSLDDGGYSLELINPMKECHDANNWSVSKHALGGTPGAVSSIWNRSVDTVPPAVLNFEIHGADSITLQFDEGISSITSTLISHQGKVFQRSYSEFSIEFDKGFTSEKYHQVYLEDLEDCQGNTGDDSIRFYLDYTPPIIKKYKFISENEIALVFHEPLDKYRAEKEEYYLINEKWNPLRSIIQDTSSFRVHLTLPGLYKDLELKMSSLEDTLENVIDTLAIELIYESQVDTVNVLSPDLLEVIFHDNPEAETLGKITNYYISELGYPEKIWQDSSLVRLKLPENLDENVEYRIYIENIRGLSGRELPTPAKTFIYDTDPPQIDEIEIRNDTLIALTFDERINLQSAVNPLNFKIEDDFAYQVIPTGKKKVELLLEHPIPPEEEIALSVSNISDLIGNSIDESDTYDIIFDPYPPVLDSVYQINDSTLMLIAHEILSDSLSELLIVFEDISNDSVRLLPDKMNRLKVFFKSELPAVKDGRLQISGWKDINGNLLKDTLTYSVNTRNPVLYKTEFISPEKIKVYFSKAIGEIDQLTINGENVESNQTEGVNVWIVKLPYPLEDTDSIYMKFTGVKSMDGYRLQNELISRAFDSFFASYEVIDNRTIELIFQIPLNPDISEIQFGGFEIPEIASIDHTDPGKIRLFYSSDIPGDTVLMLRWENLRNPYGLLVPAGRRAIYFDQSGPGLVKVESDYENHLIVYFNEKIREDHVSIMSFKVDLENPESLAFINDSTLHLSFKNLRTGDVYLLESYFIQDQYGNMADTAFFEFIYQPPAIPAVGDIVISEVMADPTPARELPEKEYLELFNNGKVSFNLKSVKFVNGGTVIELPDFILVPGEYVVLSDGENEFNIPNYVDLDRTLSLRNEGDSLVIENIRGIVVDGISYTREWYHSDEKADGGYSLELIDPNGHCDTISNWSVSNAHSGGTPGLQNSIFSEAGDWVKPEVFSSSLIDDNQILLEFSEKMDSGSLITGQYVMEGHEIKNVEFKNYKQVVIKLERNLEKGRDYSLKISDMRDCTGNEMESVSLKVIVPADPQVNDLIITEIMADPDPVKGLPSSEYLEIFNRSSRVISLKDIQLHDESGETSPLSGFIYPGEYKALVPLSAIGFYSGQNVIGVSGWRSLSNEGERIALVFGEKIISSVTFSRDWHLTESRDGGVSLERGNPENKCGMWSSSLSESGGSPGEKNTFYEPYDQSAPVFDSLIYVSEDSIRLSMNERINKPDIDNFFSESLIFSTIYFDSLKGNSISFRLLDSIEYNRIHLLELRSVKDCNGNISESIEVSMELIKPAENGLVINEILFNPATGGEDFIEFYNPTDSKYTLEGSFIANHNSEVNIKISDQILFPGQYLVLTEDREYLLSTYSAANEAAILETDQLPSMNDDEGFIIWKQASGGLIDSIWYSEEFHSPLLNNVEGVSLERLSLEKAATTSNNWSSASAIAGFATPGYENSQKKKEIEVDDEIKANPSVFVPGSTNTSVPTYTSFEYNFDSGEVYSNVTIYDSQGRFIRELAKNQLLGSSGFLRWDGTDGSGKVVQFGRYLVIFDLYEPDGLRKKIMETVVVGWK